MKYWHKGVVVVCILYIIFYKHHAKNSLYALFSFIL